MSSFLLLVVCRRCTKTTNVWRQRDHHELDINPFKQTDSINQSTGATSPGGGGGGGESGFDGAGGESKGSEGGMSGNAGNGIELSRSPTTGSTGSRGGDDTLDEMQMLREAFSFVDIDKDGKVEKQELLEALQVRYPWKAQIVFCLNPPWCA